MPSTVVDPPEALSGGRSLNPIAKSSIAPIGSPRVSAATWVMMVRVPVPKSWVPISTSTELSGLMVVRHWSGALPRPRRKPRPRPRFTGPEPPCPRGCHSFFQSANSAAFCNWNRYVSTRALGA